jgi:hypothetical protein
VCFLQKSSALCLTRHLSDALLVYMYLCVSGVGVPFAAGGGALDKGNGTETGADAAPSL